jgi:N4-gp56 family major capsid protein
MATTKQQSASNIIFSEVAQKKSMTNLLSVDAPTAVSQQKQQSSPTAPIVKVNDLTKNHGDSVSVDVVHQLTGLPVMGDGHIEGREEKLSQASHTIKINAGAKATADFSIMAQQNANYDLKQLGRTGLTDWYNSFTDERAIYHLAGARGSYGSKDRDGSNLIIPLETHDMYKELMVNDVSPATFDRALYGGNATSIDNIDSADVLNLATLRILSENLEQTHTPINPIDLSAEDKPMDTEPFYVLYVTPAQWTTLQSTTTDFNQLIANATARGNGFNHHLFKGECLMFDNILVKKYFKPVRFYEGDVVSVSNNDKLATTTTKQVATGVNVDRAILLGGQALAVANGKDGNNEGNFTIFGESFDANRKHRNTLTWVDGVSKIRFADKQGYVNDRGVITLDTAVNL